MKLKIIIINHFIHPYHGGSELKTYEYEMKDALKAEKKYNNLKKDNDNEYSFIEIYITQIGEE